MIEVVRNRLRLRFSQSPAASDDDSDGRLAGSDEFLPEVEFVAYADDCRLFGHLRLSGDRLTDMLDLYDELVLVDVLAESLSDGQVVETTEIVVTRDELLAVEATGPRGNGDRRVRTREHPMRLQAGPYRVQGYVHAQPGVDPLASVGRRGAMVPLTNAWIEFSSGGVSRLRKATTLLVNRDHAAWIAPLPHEDLAFPDEGVAADSGWLFEDVSGGPWASDRPGDRGSPSSG